MAAKKGGLGRGLEALIADTVSIYQDAMGDDRSRSKDENGADIPESDRVKYISIHDIIPNANQPRKHFDEEKIAELSNSIREHGVIQPLVVRKKGEGYEIVAGERRWRASMKAELQEVPCLIRELTDEQNMLIAIIENMQREDLNPIEEAEGLNQMIATFGLTQEYVSKSVGKSRPYITNSLRLLKLPEDIRTYLAAGKLSAGHGRALLGAKSEDAMRNICSRILNEGLSVREVEKLVNATERTKTKRPARRQKNPNVAAIEEELKEIFGTRVVINERGKKGTIEIQYFDKDELDRLIEQLKSL